MFDRIAARIKPALGALSAMSLAGPVWGHPAQQGFVLLLPTDIYIGAGTLSVALSLVLLTLVPPEALARAFRPVRLAPRPPRLAHLRVATSLASACLLIALIGLGLTGPRDPLANPLPLAIWTLWWIGLVLAQGVFGDLWAWIGPWRGPLAVLRWAFGPAPLRLPRRLGAWPALIGFLGFGLFLLVDKAPADPARLARAVAIYWVATLAAAWTFGPAWLVRGEVFTVFLRAFARVGLARRGAIGLPGWQILRLAPPSLAGALFMVAMLASGSFDGLNETFWWLARLGVNPLAFPGRSAVAGANAAGLLASTIALMAVFAGTLWLGLWLARAEIGLSRAIRIFAPTLLPIALGYHAAHYLPSLLVDAQYALIAATDPLARGDDWLGLGQVYVTTGFFNTQDSVRRIFLTQAGAVVAGHVLAAILAHALAARHLGSTRRAVLSQAPLAVFMVAYTLFGLWLLAVPRGA